MLEIAQASILNPVKPSELLIQSYEHRIACYSRASILVPAFGAAFGAAAAAAAAGAAASILPTSIRLRASGRVYS